MQCTNCIHCCCMCVYVKIKNLIHCSQHVYVCTHLYIASACAFIDLTCNCPCGLKKKLLWLTQLLDEYLIHLKGKCLGKGSKREGS